jgi:hypothetical protein
MKKANAKITIACQAKETVSLADFETASRDNRIEIEIELPVGVDEGRIDLSQDFQTRLQAIQQGLQLQCEAGMYSALARAYSSRHQNGGLFARAAKDRFQRALAIFESGLPEMPDTLSIDPGAPLQRNPDVFRHAA